MCSESGSYEPLLIWRRWGIVVWGGGGVRGIPVVLDSRGLGGGGSWYSRGVGGGREHHFGPFWEKDFGAISRGLLFSRPFCFTAELGRE